MNKLSFAGRKIIINSVYKVANLLTLNKNTLSILCYHSISNAKDRYSIPLDIFSKQIRKIAEYARFISLDETLGEIKGKEVVKPAVAITIDDGYVDILKILPIAQKYNIPITLFVLANSAKANRREIEHSAKLLTFKQLNYLKSIGWTIGCHSATHSDFSSLNQKEVHYEVVVAKEILEKKLGTKIKYFAYPKGVYSTRIIESVQRAGYKAAFSIGPSCVSTKTIQWIVPRVIIDRTHILEEIPAVYSPSTFFVRKVTDPLKLWNKFLNL